MKCPDSDELMMLLDGELTDERRRGLEEHLGSCQGCRRAFEAQKRLESVWRESWNDPGETAFEFMRGRILKDAPWWKRQRNWMAIAAVFAVYLGVKFFLIDPGSRPVSRALSEEMVSSSPAAEVTVVADAPEEAGDVLEEDVIPEDGFRGEPEQTEEMFDREETEEEAVVEEIGPMVETAAETEISYTSTAEQPEPGSQALGGVVLSDLDDQTVDLQHGLAGTTGVQGAESQEEGIQFGYGQIAVGSGGSAGGGGVSETVSVCADEMEDSQEAMDACRCSSDSVLEEEAPAPGANQLPAYTVLAGDSMILSREDWPELFDYLDEELSMTGTDGETLVVLTAGEDISQGDVEIPSEIMDTLPEEYRDMTVTVMVLQAN